MPAGIGYPFRPLYGSNTSPELQNIQAATARMQGAVAARQQKLAGLQAQTPAQSAQRLGYNPSYGLGGVGGQYVPNMANAAGVPSAAAMMDPRQRAGAAMPVRSAGIPRQGFTTMIGTPTPGGLSPEVAAGRQAFAANRRASALQDRMAMVQANGMINADARRARMGNFTVDERMLMGVPGLAVERERGGMLRDVAGINADAQLGVAGIGAQSGERIQGMRNDLGMAEIGANRDIALGNQRTLNRTSRRDARSRERVAEIQGKYGVQQAEIGAGPAQTTADANSRMAASGEAKGYIDLANSMNNQALALENQGNYRAAEQLRAQAAQYQGLGASMLPGGLQQAPQQPAAGGPAANRPLAPQAMERYKANMNDPKMVVNQMRQDGLTDQEINVALAQLYGQGSFMGLSTGIYDRTSDNPGGWGFETVDPSTGEVGSTLLGSLFPNRRSVERDRRRNPGLMHESLP